MSKVDIACEAIIKEFTGNMDYTFEKKAEVANTRFAVKLPTIVSFKKIASEIRKTAAPVEVSYNDVNAFIKELNV